MFQELLVINYSLKRVQFVVAPTVFGSFVTKLLQEMNIQLPSPLLFKLAKCEASTVI